MTIYTGNYEVIYPAVYVADVNGAVWDYKIIKQKNRETLYLIATEMITGTTIHNQEIKTEDYLKDAEAVLEQESSLLSLVK